MDRDRIASRQGGTRMVRLVVGLAALALVGCVGSGRPTALKKAPARGPAQSTFVAAEPARHAGEIPVVPLPPLFPKDKDKSPAKAEPKAVTPVAVAGQPQPGVLPPVEPTPPAAAAPAEGPPAVAPLEQVFAQAQARYAQVDSYIARLVRREVVGGKREPEEVMLFKFRKQPYSVYFKWLGEAAPGREVVYAQGKHDNKIQTLLAAGDVPFMPAGKRMALSPDNILVQSASRYPITRAGFGSSLERLLETHAAAGRGDATHGRLADLGVQKRPDYATPLRVVEHQLPPNYEKPLPRGGKRVICFCTECNLPVLVQTFDDQGQECEYYRYDRLQLGVGLDDHDFNPDVLWKKP